MKYNPLLYKISSINQGIRSISNLNHSLYLRQRTRFGWRGRIAILLITAALGLANGLTALAGSQIDIVGPPGSGSFGSSITVLPNGNFVVTDPGYDIPNGATDVGAVYLYNGATHALISTLTGSTSDDQVGSAGVQVLSNGNYLVWSPIWDNGSTIDVGAVTWGSGSIGVSGTVSSNNSLVGSTSDGLVGHRNSGCFVTELSNGNYVVSSPYWDNGSATDAGAVTWGSGTTGVSGVISSSNSLVGSTSDDRIGAYSLTTLSNGNYVVISPGWDNGSVTDAGAATWGNGTTGVSGEVNSNNSLVGSTSGDQVGGYLGALSNGNYVVISPVWDNGNATDAGAVTWGNGATGISGAISRSNSLVGSTSDDRVGGSGYSSFIFYSVTVLSNGNYIVHSSLWDNGSAIDAGAVTWGNGTSGVSGEINSSNSLVGSTSYDSVGTRGVTELSNGNYVVSSPYWDNGSDKGAGAVTWGNGATGISGEVSSSNSLVGMSNDIVGSSGVITLNNGNYLVCSSAWNNGSAKGAGAMTWGNGATGISGVVSSNNSLVGSTNDDQVGIGNSGCTVTELSNGNYVVHSPKWDNGSATDAGAVTWGNGATGVSGVVGSNNSLVGSTSDDSVGAYGNLGYSYPIVKTLSNGNYVVYSPVWDNGSITDAGAVTWGNGTTGVSGEISSSNSLVGSTSDDRIGIGDVTVLSNGNYVVRSPYWDNGSATNAGAVTWGNGNTGVSGVISSNNSLVGTSNSSVGHYEVTALSNGNYVVCSPDWNNGNTNEAGAVTWGNGTTGISGEVSSSNSLVGSTSYDRVGSSRVITLNNGNYVIGSASWDNGIVFDAGAVTWGNGATGVSGVISSSNSLVGSAFFDQVGYGFDVTALSNGNYVIISSHWNDGRGAVTWGNGTTGVKGILTLNNSILGTVPNAGSSMNFRYEATFNRLIIGRPAENIVTLFDVAEEPIGNERVYLPAISR